MKNVQRDVLVTKLMIYLRKIVYIMRTNYLLSRIDKSINALLLDHELDHEVVIFADRWIAPLIKQNKNKENRKTTAAWKRALTSQ